MDDEADDSVDDGVADDNVDTSVFGVVRLAVSCASSLFILVSLYLVMSSRISVLIP